MNQFNPPAKLPRHIAIIMDGNGRWAQNRGHARTFGHVRGAARAHEMTTACARMGIESLTLYTFSMENWQRPQIEVAFLWRLLIRELNKKRPEILENNIRFQCIGFNNLLPENVQKTIKNLTEESSSNTGMWLNLALSYGSRQEIVHASRLIAKKVAAGELKPEDISEDMFSAHLFTSGLPEPDLMIRTGGDQRVSNFLLWQIAYTELLFEDMFWPDFTTDHLKNAIERFGSRERRFGKVSTRKNIKKPDAGEAARS